MLTSQRREEVLVGSDVAERMNRVGCKMTKMMKIMKIKMKHYVNSTQYQEDSMT